MLGCPTACVKSLREEGLPFSPHLDCIQTFIIIIIVWPLIFNFLCGNGHIGTSHCVDGVCVCVCWLQQQNKKKNKISF